MQRNALNDIPRMPVLFIGHGSPMNALEDNAWTKAWCELGQQLPQPRNILCLSAHFARRGSYVVDVERPKTIHDFYGFPPELYAMRYPAPGSPELADRVRTLLPEAKAASDWGLDHGAWSPLCRIYPEANIPVVQLSLDLSLTPEKQMDIGRRLAPLRMEGTLILGSGNVVHNLGRMNPSRADPFPWAESFGEAVHRLMLSRELEKLAGYASLPGAGYAVPTTEHFVPLLYAMGAADTKDRLRAFNHDYAYASLSMTAYLMEA